MVSYPEDAGSYAPNALGAEINERLDVFRAYGRWRASRPWCWLPAVASYRLYARRVQGTVAVDAATVKHLMPGRGR